MFIPRRIFLVAVSAVLVQVLSAGFSRAQISQREVYGLPGEYLYTFGGSVRAMGMGCAYTAVSGESSAAYWNPAGLYSITCRQASFFYSRLFSDTRYHFLSFAYPVYWGGAFSFSWLELLCPEVEQVVYTGGNWVRGPHYNDRQSLYLLSYGGKLYKAMSWGINTKVFTHHFMNSTGQGYGIDMGLLFVPSPHLSFGLASQNVFVTPLKLETEEEKFPLNVRAGVSVSPTDKNILIFSGDIQMIDVQANEGLYLEPTGGPLAWYLGAEGNVGETLSLRAGYNDRGVSLGFGLGSRYFDFDYALGLHSISPVHYFSLTCRFGMPPSVEEKEIERQRWEMEVQESYLLALRWYNAGNVVQAKQEIHRLLSLDPDNTKGQELLETVHHLEVEKMSGIQRIKKANDAFSFSLKEYRAQRYDEARMRVEEVLVLNPQHEEAVLLRHLIRARQFLLKGNQEAAKARMMEALKINPDYPEAIELFRLIKEKRY